jgi:hypothetical protein
MKYFLTLFSVVILFSVALIAFSHTAATTASYSTEATITPMADNGQYKVDVSISHLVQKNGRLVEEVVARPRIQSNQGCAASFYQGPSAGTPGYGTQDNFSVDVSWPYPNESGTAFCTVLVKHGDTVVSKSKLQLQIVGPGRVPLILSAQNVDPNSVQVSMDKSTAYVLLEFAGKTDGEARKMAIDNFGNQAQIRNAAGQIVDVVDGGHVAGAYNGIGLALPYDTADEAQRVANVLKGLAIKL